jgi:hypothetical protein
MRISSVSALTSSRSRDLLRSTLRPRATIQYADQIRDVAFEGVREAKENRQARQHETALDVADERDARRAVLRDISLSEATRNPELA